MQVSFENEAPGANVINELRIFELRILWKR
jgi:hypothetical protein